MTVRPDGSRRRSLASDACRVDGSTREDFGNPAWSRDGQRIAFRVTRGNPFTVGVGAAVSSLAVMRADGSARREIPLDVAPPHENEYGDRLSEPSFDPSGSRVVYTRSTPDNYEIWRTRVDGRGDKRLTNGVGPHWSPDGHTIAYTVSASFGNPPAATLGMWLMNARTGLTIDRLGAAGEVEDWSPNGRRLLVNRGYDLYSIRVTGRHARRMTFTPGVEELDAAWSPDGRRIAFVTRREDFEEDEVCAVWTANAAGGSPQRIYRIAHSIEDSGCGIAIDWQPLTR